MRRKTSTAVVNTVSTVPPGNSPVARGSHQGEMARGTLWQCIHMCFCSDASALMLSTVLVSLVLQRWVVVPHWLSDDYSFISEASFLTPHMGCVGQVALHKLVQEQCMEIAGVDDSTQERIGVKKINGWYGMGGHAWVGPQGQKRE